MLRRLREDLSGGERTQVEGGEGRGGGVREDSRGLKKA